MSFFKTFEHLLPRALAWFITLASPLRDWFLGMVDLPQNVRDYIDSVYESIWPARTDHLDEWENQWALREAGLGEADRRTRIDAAWKSTGRQDPRYLRDQLQANGFDVEVYEWWETPVIDPQAPIAIDPDVFGGGVWLVNKVQTVTSLAYGANDVELHANRPEAYAGDVYDLSYGELQYSTPPEAEWPYVLYIAGLPFGFSIAPANIPAERRTEFEVLCKSLAPAQQWLYLKINYT